MKNFTMSCLNDNHRNLVFHKYDKDIGIIDLLEYDERNISPNIYECTGISHNQFDVLIYNLVTKAIDHKSKLIQFHRWYPYYDSRSMTGIGNMYISPTMEYNNGDKDMKLTLKVNYNGLNKTYVYSLNGRKNIDKFVKFLTD